MNDKYPFVQIIQLDLPCAKTWGQPGAGNRDRERVRQAAARQGLRPAEGGGRYRVEISVTKRGRRPFDIENTIKPIVDAFSMRQISIDRSDLQVGLYEDDTIDHVIEITVRGERGDEDATRVAIYRAD